ncbi:MAG: hypothetical protein Q8K79_00160 [Solirubrobacteraceae bacterium]|nr:hypothetical protein [Solirubrobacteraceae bacterium]
MPDGYEALTEALVRAAQRGDWSLDRLLRFADAGFAPAISLLVDGRWIEGILTTEEDWADRLDADVDAGIGWASERTAAEFGSISDPAQVPDDAPMVGDIEEFRQTLRENNFRQFVDDRRAVEEALAQRIEGLGDDEELSAADQRQIDALADPLAVITLRNVIIEGAIPANNRGRPMLRVLRAHVAAWHLGRSATIPSGPGAA